jgi:hypothetical protein
MLLAGFLTAGLLFVVMVPDKGEVIRLITEDEAGEQRVTELWIATLDGQEYIRASDPDAHWLARLQSTGPARIERDGETVEIETIVDDDPRIRAQLNGAMSEKYGLADRLWGMLGDRSASIPIRLDPAEGLASARGDES